MLPTTSQSTPSIPSGVSATTALMGALLDGDVGPGSLSESPLGVPTSPAAHRSQLWQRAADEPYGMPRRFGLGTIMLLTTLFGILLTALIENGVPRLGVAVVVTFVFLIGAAQVILFGGKHPRKASIVAGAILVALIAVSVGLVERNFRGQVDRNFLGTALFGLPLWASLGGLFGYASGGIVAGIFLIMDHAEQAQDWIKRYARHEA